MKNLIIILTLILFSVGNYTYAQGKYGEIGKLYTYEEGLKLYGPAIESVEIATADLVSMLDKCENYMMFTIKNHELIITNDYRQVLTRHKIQLTSNKPTQKTGNNDIIDDDEVLNVFSKSAILKMVESTGSKTISFDKREKVYTIGIGDIILFEMSIPCPPFC